MAAANKGKRKKSNAGTDEQKPRSLFSFLVFWTGVTAVVLFLGSIYIRSQVVRQLKTQALASSSVVYSRAFPLDRLVNLASTKLVERAERLGYHKVTHLPERRGEYQINRDSVYIFLRGGVVSVSHTQPEQLVKLSLDTQGMITEINDVATGRPLKHAWLEPEILSLLGESSQRAELPKTLPEFSPFLIKGLLAIEDERFYSHLGIDPLAILRAMTANLRSHRIVQGGSTITQQLAKNLFLDSQRSLLRKLKEAVAAILIETAFTKDQILELYLNQVFLGQEGRVAVHGFGEASRSFFDKDVGELTLSEAATLAGMVKAPTSYSPRRYPERAQKRKLLVLEAMAEQGKITKDQQAKAAQTEIVVKPAQRNKRNAPYFIDYVRRELPKFISESSADSNALRIYSGIDVQMQDCAEKAVKSGLKKLEQSYKWMSKLKEPLQAALIATVPASGEVVAWVGGRNYAKNQFDRVSQASRQPGSAFKPFVYLTALDKDLNSYRVARTTSTLMDEPLTLHVPGSGTWEPKNYDKEYHGEVTVREALAKSLNIPTVSLAMKVGIDSVAHTAALFGFGDNLPHVPSLALGAGDVSPLTMARAYSGIVNGGSIVELRPVLSALSAEDNSPVFEALLSEHRVASEPAVFVLTTILQSVIEQGTGQAVRRLGFTRPAAGKTGTSNDARDAWFVGFTPRLLAVVWVGFDNNREINLTGSVAAVPIWTDFMKCASEMEAPLDFVPPDGVVYRRIDKESGLLDEGYCPEQNVINEVFVEGTEPISPCPLHSQTAEEPQVEQPVEQRFPQPQDDLFSSGRVRTGEKNGLPRARERRPSTWPPARRDEEESFWDKIWR